MHASCIFHVTVFRNGIAEKMMGVNSARTAARAMLVERMSRLLKEVLVEM